MEQTNVMPRPEGALAPEEPKKGLSAGTLKYIAVAAMLIDHIAWGFVPTASPLGIAMHFVGRITGPTMFYFLAEGYHYTRNKNRYTLRLGLFALISWLPFYYFEFGTLPSFPQFYPFGVIYTLFLGFLAIRARHEIKNPLLRAGAILVLIALSIFGDWPLYGVILPLVFDVFRGNFKRQAVAASIVFIFSIVPDVVIFMANGVPFSLQNYAFVLMQMGQFLPLILLKFYNGAKGGGGAFSKWFFYIVYPAHLVVLGLLRFEVFGQPRRFF